MKNMCLLVNKLEYTTCVNILTLKGLCYVAICISVTKQGLHFHDNNLKNQYWTDIVHYFRHLAKFTASWLFWERLTSNDAIHICQYFRYLSTARQEDAPSMFWSVVPPLLMQFVELQREGSDPTSRQSPRMQTPLMSGRQGRSSWRKTKAWGNIQNSETQKRNY